MKFEKTKLDGVFKIRLEPKKDNRGYFVRTFCKNEFIKAGIKFVPVQINRSLTKKRGTVRGMHFQTAPYQEDKVVQCLSGKIYDIVLDLRKGSKTYGHWIGVTLTSENNTALFIPKGYAHGFQTLTPNCEVEYFMSEFYSSQNASGVRNTDPRFNISWPLPISYISKKDACWPLI